MISWTIDSSLRLAAARAVKDLSILRMSIGKLFWAGWHRRMGELLMQVKGAAGMVGDDGAHAGHGVDGAGDHPEYSIDKEQRTFLYSRAHTIYGGSNQVQRNVIGERVLGLPREPRSQERR